MRASEASVRVYLGANVRPVRVQDVRAFGAKGGQVGRVVEGQTKDNTKDFSGEHAERRKRWEE